MYKPGILYHASSVKDLEVIEPKRTISKDKYIGDYVFATADKRVAAMYLAPRQGGTILINTFDGEPYAVINNNVDSFRRVDRGGAIYELPHTEFIDSPQVELRETEKVSTRSIIPISSEVFESSLDAMKHMGVKVFFLNNSDFESVMNAKDHGWKLLQKFTAHSV